MGGFQYTGLLIGLYFGVLFTFTSGAANVTVGSTCNGTCSPIPNAVCNKTCQCSPHYFVPSSNNATCLAKIAVNAACHTQDVHQCTDSNAECKSNNGIKCLCKDAYYLKGSACTSQIAVNAVCNAKDKHQCKDINAECKNSNGTKCLCKDAYYWNATACTTRIQVNATCTPAEKGCIKNAICKTTKCQCKVGYTYRNTSCSGVSKISIEISTSILAILALRCNKWFVE